MVVGALDPEFLLMAGSRCIPDPEMLRSVRIWTGSSSSAAAAGTAVPAVSSAADLHPAASSPSSSQLDRDYIMAMRVAQ